MNKKIITLFLLVGVLFLSLGVLSATNVTDDTNLEANDETINDTQTNEELTNGTTSNYAEYTITPTRKEESVDLTNVIYQYPQNNQTELYGFLVAQLENMNTDGSFDNLISILSDVNNHDSSDINDALNQLDEDDFNLVNDLCKNYVKMDMAEKLYNLNDYELLVFINDLRNSNVNEYDNLLSVLSQPHFTQDEVSDALNVVSENNYSGIQDILNSI